MVNRRSRKAQGMRSYTLRLLSMRRRTLLAAALPVIAATAFTATAAIPAVASAAPVPAARHITMPGRALPSTAFAAGCYAAGCNGQDPHAMGCDQDAQTVASVDTSDGLVNLRWSNTCQANWAQVQNVSTWGINFWVINKAGDKQSYGWGWFGPASGWSNMVNGHKILDQACDNNGCTAWK
jgi:Protein of unknown function (DUF2690)